MSEELDHHARVCCATLTQKPGARKLLGRASFMDKTVILVEFYRYYYTTTIS